MPFLLWIRPLSFSRGISLFSLLSAKGMPLKYNSLLLRVTLHKDYIRNVHNEDSLYTFQMLMEITSVCWVCLQATIWKPNIALAWKLCIYCKMLFSSSAHHQIRVKEAVGGDWHMSAGSALSKWTEHQTLFQCLHQCLHEESGEAAVLYILQSLVP